MLIVGKQILDDNLLLDADEKQIRNASYYLTIDAIIPAGPQAAQYDPTKPKHHHTMMPRDIVWVVSKERFNIKTYNVTALVTLRSTFTKKGLLALDVGLVDPDYEGPIGSIVINFSKENIPLHQGDPFFRVIFMLHPNIEDKYKVIGRKYSTLEYIQERHADLSRGFPATFLDTQDLTQTVSDKLINDIQNYVIRKYWWKALIVSAVIVAIMTVFLVPLYNRYFPSFSDGQMQDLIRGMIVHQLGGKQGQ